MNEQWRKAIRQKNRLWKGFIRERTDTNYELYKRQRNICTSLRRKAIKTFFDKKSESENPREFWNTYRPFLHSRKSTHDIILKEHDVVITDKKQMAELFSSYFVNIADGVPEITEQSYGKELDAHPSIQAIFNNNEQLAVRNKFAFQYTNKTQVGALLLKINSRRSCSHDGIPPRLIKESANAIAGPIAAIMNHSIRTGQYPSRWKLGQVTPLFKKDDELNISNYRPVTVLPALTNVFERLLSAQMGDFYQNILSEYVSAYRRHHSCETSLLRLTEDWRRSLDNKEIVAVISMDLSKAFDTVPHALLLAKLKAYDLHESSCALIGDYLTDRMQRVSENW